MGLDRILRERANPVHPRNEPWATPSQGCSGGGGEWQRITELGWSIVPEDSSPICCFQPGWTIRQQVSSLMNRSKKGTLRKVAVLTPLQAKKLVCLEGPGSCLSAL